MPNLKQIIGGSNYTNFDGYEFVDNTMQTIPGIWNKVTKSKKVIVFENITYSKNGVKYDLGTCTLNFNKVHPYVYAYIIKDIVSGGAVTLFQVRISNQDKMLIKAVSSTNAQEVDISGKADKVENAHAGNFAGLDNTGNLIDSGLSPEDIGGVDYSTSEQDTGIKWIDGSTIYRKVFHITTFVPYVENIAGQVNCKNIVNCHSVTVLNTGLQLVDFQSPYSKYQMYIGCNNGAIIFALDQTDARVTDMYIIAEYTKN